MHRKHRVHEYREIRTKLSAIKTKALTCILSFFKRQIFVIETDDGIHALSKTAKSAAQHIKKSFPIEADLATVTANLKSKGKFHGEFLDRDTNLFDQVLCHKMPTV